MARVTVKLTGTKDVQKALERAGERWERAVAQAVYLEGNNVMGKSKRLVPVDLGVLRASGYVTMPETQGNTVIVELGYGGGPSREYAVVQHERTDFQHPEGGQAKYLQAAVDDRAAKMGANIAALAKAAFNRNQGPQRNMATPVDPDQGAMSAAAEAIGKAFKAFGKSLRKGGGKR